MSDKKGPMVKFWLKPGRVLYFSHRTHKCTIRLNRGGTTTLRLKAEQFISWGGRWPRRGELVYIYVNNDNQAHRTADVYSEYVFTFMRSIKFDVRIVPSPDPKVEPQAMSA